MKSALEFKEDRNKLNEGQENSTKWLKKIKIMQDVNRDRNLRNPRPEMKKEIKNSVNLMVTR